MTLMESSQKLKIGSKVPEFSLMGVDGKTYSPSDFSEAKALAIIFMCNHCPYVLAKIDALKSLYAHYRPRGVAIVGINPNNNPDYPQDDFEHMKQFAREKEIPFPYLFDKDQNVAKAFGAVCTPDPFLFDGQHLLAYHGRIDDALSPEATPTTHDLADAIDAVLAGSLPRNNFLPSRGCSIKWRE